jgi:hypothetical protein
MAKWRAEEAYGKMPLSFEANLGQADSQVKFLSRGRGHTLFLTSTEVVLSLQPGDVLQKQEHPATDGEPMTADVVRMKLRGANCSAVISGLDQLAGRANYFINNDSKKWRANIPTYSSVKYEQVYPGVDLVYYGNQRQLEYDFILAPGADPRAIALTVEGVDDLEIDARGDLLLRTADRQITQRKPIVYQEVDGRRQVIEANYSTSSGREFGFEIADYDRSKPLVIDPVLSYSTYLGGSGSDTLRSIAVDSSGDAYVVGFTPSVDFPVSSPFQPSNAGSDDIVVTRLNAAGSTLIYSTYIGGSDVDAGTAIAVDSAGNAYITGDAESTDFPVTAGVFQTTYGGKGGGLVNAGDSFVSKLDPTGSSLIYSTYLGGPFNEQGNDIAIDSAGCAYVVSFAAPLFPTTAGSFQPAAANFLDAAVTKLNATGSALVYSTFLGGSGFEVIRGIALDSSGNAYVTGSTNSTDFPTTSGAFQTAFAGGGGEGDVFVTRLDAAGASLIYSTYLGGSSEEQGGGIALDSAGSAYLTGRTQSIDFPTATPVQGSNSGGSDIYAAKLDAAGSALIYSTYLGGSSFDAGNGITVDVLGNAYLACASFSADAAVVNPVQISNGGGEDAYIVTLNVAGTAILFSSYLGGSGNDFAYDIAVDNAGGIYVAGDVGSTDFPTAGAVQPANAGGNDGFVAKFDDNQLTELGPAKVWIGLKNSDDVGTKFDLLAEALKNGSLVGSGTLNGVPGGSSGFNNAVLRTLNLALASPVSVGPADTLSIRLSVRIAVGVPGHRSGTARLWFNDTAANSRFDATIGGLTSDYFLLSGFTLGTATGPGPKKTIDVFVDRAAGGNPFKPFGTWSKTF